MLFICSLLVSCTGNTEIAIENLSLSENTLELKVGEEHTFSVEISPTNATNQAVTWSSSNPNVALTNDNTVYALQEGTAIIYVRAQNGNVEASCVVNVKAPTAYEQLSEKERAVYEAILSISYQFKNPSSVRVVSGGGIVTTGDGAGSGFYRLSATNSFGATTTDYYVIAVTPSQSIVQSISSYATSEEIAKCLITDEFDIVKVNNALNEKWSK